MARNIMDMTDSIYDQIDRLMNADNADVIAIECSRAESLSKLVQTAQDSVKTAVKVMEMANNAVSPTTEYAAKRMLGVGDGR